MKARFQALPLAVAPLLLSATAAAPDAPRFAVEKGTTVRKHFDESTEWTVTSLRQVVNGIEQPMPPLEVEGRTTAALVLVDEYVEMAAGRPEVLRREVERADGGVELGVSVEGETEDYALALATPLSGAELRFDWDDEEQAFELEAETAGLPDDALQLLVEDADLRGVLPPADTEEGASWKLDAAALAGLLHPGGTFGLRPRGLPDGSFQLIDVEDVLATGFLDLAAVGAEPSGKGEATWTETREVEGERLAVLTLDFELELDGDASDAYSRSLGDSGVDTERDDVYVELDWKLLGEGELLWNLSAGRFESYELELTGELEVSLRWLQSYGDADVEAEISAELETRSELIASVGGQ